VATVSRLTRGTHHATSSTFSTSSTMATIAPARLAALTRLRCSIFQTSYNPTSVRTGAKYLKARLRGPSMISYYPQTLSISAIIKESPELGLVDYKEQQRLQDVKDRKARGKGAPKKIKEKGINFLRFLVRSYD
jgi:small subunit ribosomal protein S33